MEKSKQAKSIIAEKPEQVKELIIDKKIEELKVLLADGVPELTATRSVVDMIGPDTKTQEDAIGECALIFDAAERVECLRNALNKYQTK